MFVVNELIYLIIIYIRRQCVCIINSLFLVFINIHSNNYAAHTKYICLFGTSSLYHQDSNSCLYWKLSSWKKRKNNLINKMRYTHMRACILWTECCGRLPHVLWCLIQEFCTAYTHKYNKSIWKALGNNIKYFDFPSGNRLFSTSILSPLVRTQFKWVYYFIIIWTCVELCFRPFFCVYTYSYLYIYIHNASLYNIWVHLNTYVLHARA